MIKTVDDMYKHSSSVVGMKLLSDYNADFWSDYRTNYQKYDRLFRRRYKSFKFFDQSFNDSIANVTTDFVNAVYDHLLINNKKYSELYRVQVVDDNKYSLLDNYNVTETMDKDTTSNDDNTYGSRIDSGSNTIGSQSNSITEEVAPYNSGSFQNDSHSSTSLGSRSDSSSVTKGQQIDNLDNTYTEDYTLTRVGNIGVQTGADMMDKHKKFWSMWQFYEYIFNELCKELLLI